MSRRIEAYRVACGVLPPGVDHKPWASIASTISLQFIGLRAFFRTAIAALTWLILVGAVGVLLAVVDCFLAGLLADFLVAALVAVAFLRVGIVSFPLR